MSRKISNLFKCTVMLVTCLSCGVSPSTLSKQEDNDKRVRAVSSAFKSVVNVSSVTEKIDEKTNKLATFEELGSAVCINSRGYLLTNHHVIAGAKKIVIIGHDDVSRPAKIVASDKQSDLALIKIAQTPALPKITVGDSENLQLAEAVVAIGNPYGYQSSISAGIVSQKNRNILVDDGLELRGLIQTDAAINPGNSGGALINYDGELVGINTAVHNEAQGVSFVIPINQAIKKVQELLDGLGVEKPSLGVELESLTLNNKNVHNLKVRSVQPNSRAARAGIKAGDIIIGHQGRNAMNRIKYQESLSHVYELDLELIENRDKPFFELVVFRPKDNSYKAGKNVVISIVLAGSDEQAANRPLNQNPRNNGESVLRPRSNLVPIRRPQNPENNVDNGKMHSILVPMDKPQSNQGQIQITPLPPIQTPGERTTIPSWHNYTPRR